MLNYIGLIFRKKYFCLAQWTVQMFMFNQIKQCESQASAM